MNFLDRNELLLLVQKVGLHAERQEAYFKVSSGGRILHFSASKRVTKIHLKGFDRFHHEALKEMTADEAARTHRGRVNLQFDFSKPPEVLRSGFIDCLDYIRTAGTPPVQKSGDSLPTMVLVSARIRRELYEKIDAERGRLNTQTPGLELGLSDMVRILLTEAIANRDEGGSN